MSFEQQTHHREIAVCDRDVKWSHTVTVFAVRIGARAQQLSGGRNILQTHDPMQRRSAVMSECVAIGMVPEHLADRLYIAFFRDVRERSRPSYVGPQTRDDAPGR